MNRLSELNDRILWYDGSITVPSTSFEDYIQYTDITKVYVDTLTDELKQYNKFVKSNEKIKTRSDVDEVNIKNNWLIPKEVMDIDINEHLNALLVEESLERDFSDSDIKIRMNRVQVELRTYKKLKLIPVLHAIIYIINTFEENNVIWGVGRGSSVSSYILYLLKIHDIDSIKYDLDFSEFMR